MTMRTEHWVRDDQWTVELEIDEDGHLTSFSRLPTMRGPLNTNNYEQVAKALQTSGYRRLVE